ncbi:MAG TPA: DUF4426 domain-containing protein [Luteimonas sp.]|nr:DUF4426 domain-containing protein [Luteimonas sp.]
MNRLLRPACLALFLLLSACGGNAPPAKPAAQAADAGATVSGGDFVIHANALQTSALNETVAKGYGIARDDKTVLLIVAVRTNDAGAERSLPARVSVTVAGLTGDKRSVEMREQRTGDLVDYVGTVETSLPETLRFDITATLTHGGIAKAQFSREFYPR